MAYKYRATCHTKCYWLHNLWQVGEVYEGNEKPNKHFNADGIAPEVPPPTPMDDPRPTVELKTTLEKHPFNFTVPEEWKRKEIWAKLQEMELMASKDALTSDEGHDFIAACGFESKSRAGVSAHERSCVKCKEKKQFDGAVHAAESADNEVA
ncbi:MAG: hypothetical protein BBJ57_02175 [Desulfobacterales bacterium PC51MH44]|nr:MAG: hypothetical protein BBJ57_02175 [Desulfobacterales bacterium PC51MH44]